MIDDFYTYSPYELEKKAKTPLLTKELLELTQFHYEQCQPYRNLLDGMSFQAEKVGTLLDIPFFPVRLFKEMRLLSIPEENIFKTMTSSGTTGQAVSRIYLDQATAMTQQKVMLRILADYVGKKRLPMLVVDSQAIVQNRQQFTARGAAIMGLRIAATEQIFILDETMELQTDVFMDFLEKHAGQPFLIFGFTFMVWQHLYKELLRMSKRIDLSQAVLMTSGGWKKLQSEAVTPLQFKQCFEEISGIHAFLDHYAMVEQTGCMYAECEKGHLHASIFSDIIPRRYRDFSPCEIGEPGILQLVSVIPRSYPGHSLISEDEGVILGEDNCPCGRKGKYFKINGRIKKAELRGCSDTYASKF